MRAILVPVKAFHRAKARLSVMLSEDQRVCLAQELATTVLSAAGTSPIFVVCDDGEVADFASKAGAYVLWTPGLGLSGAVNAGVEYLGQHDFDLAIVAHGDLPFATDLSTFGDEGVVTLAPDRRLDGTNVAAVPTGSGFSFSYGPGSFERHQKEAERVGLLCHIESNPELAIDVDTVDDLALVQQRLREGSVGDKTRDTLNWLTDITLPNISVIAAVDETR